MQKLWKKDHSDAHITLKLMNTLTPVNKAFICILNSNKLFEQLSLDVKVIVQYLKISLYDSRYSTKDAHEKVKKKSQQTPKNQKKNVFPRFPLVQKFVLVFPAPEGPE